MTTRDRLVQTFRDALGLSPEVDIPSLTYRSISEWNSVGHMQLVAGIETEFDVMLETEQIIDMSSFDKALEILASHGIDTAS
ncbi:acyl carrier protein [Telmatospirillum sp. J64-1]|uniref:acyl carrier protein n=1 Tax=Telmatospirillum sp. J64-1 TaxID=2502183 RepID=UPI00115D844E|nr:acyl carrier protein [Telmatospirillum sp. J64-1]